MHSGCSVRCRACRDGWGGTGHAAVRLHPAPLRWPIQGGGAIAPEAIFESRCDQQALYTRKCLPGTRAIHHLVSTTRDSLHPHVITLLAALFHHFKEPIMLVEGKQQWLFDETGRRYLDASHLSRRHAQHRCALSPPISSWTVLPPMQ